MSFFPAPGERFEPEALRLDRPQQVRDALAWYPFARLIEARQRVTSDRYEEVLVVEIECEVPQDTEHQIQPVERLALGFERNDSSYPSVQALRTDFPAVPHLYWTPAGEPRSLCLYEAPWAEVGLRWTSAGFLGDIARWLARTAVGKLHEADQRLEPFLFAPHQFVVVPSDLWDGRAERKTYVAVDVHEGKGKASFLKLQPAEENERPESGCLHVVAAVGKPTVQASMHDCPRNMTELIELLTHGGIDLVSVMVEQLKRLFETGYVPRQTDGLLLLVKLPRERGPKSGTEALEPWAFAMSPIRAVAIATGHFEASGTREPLGHLLKPQFDEAKARAMVVDALLPVRAMDRAAAKLLSGLDSEREDPEIVLAGVGALGSQLHDNLSRMGWGRWTLIDEDTLLPHNVIRHRLGEHAVGDPKALAVDIVNGMETPHNPVVRAFAENVLSIATNEEMLAACRQADLILDASTSIAAARFLARDLDSPARRASVFLNPNGQDAVMLMEDSERSLPLDALEAQYYRAVLRDDRLERHIRCQEHFRYSAGCREVTARIGQDDVALASALLAKQVRCVGEEAMAAIWQQQADGSIRRVEVPLSDMVRKEHEDWGFVLDRSLVEHASALRSERLPAETGGVLVGYFDVAHRNVYIVDALPAPHDSEEREDSFIRGCADLCNEIRRIEARTGGQVGYVGEWHSHPDGAEIAMSGDDCKLLQEIAEEVRTDGWPGIMMIVGTNQAVVLYASEA